MKNLSLVVLISATLLTACGNDKAQETDTATTANPVATEAKAPVETAIAEDTGEAIHQANCVRCHASIVYTREGQKITSLEGLTSQVKMCDTQLETQLFPKDLDKVVTYLNETFYKF